MSVDRDWGGCSDRRRCVGKRPQRGRAARRLRIASANFNPNASPKRRQHDRLARARRRVNAKPSQESPGSRQRGGASFRAGLRELAVDTIPLAVQVRGPKMGARQHMLRALIAARIIADGAALGCALCSPASRYRESASTACASLKARVGADLDGCSRNEPAPEAIVGFGRIDRQPFELADALLRG